jgi:hypothetical protein
MKYFPDMRRILNELQRYGTSGNIDNGILVNLSEEQIKTLVGFLKTKNLPEVRKWIVNNQHLSETDVIRRLYEALYGVLSPQSIPQAILILGEYQKDMSRVADLEIHMMACMVQIMMTCEFK